MKRISYILLLLILMSSCSQNDPKSNVETKSRSKRDLSKKQVEVKKTAEETLRERLSEEDKRSLDFLKEALGNDSKFNQFVLLNESKVKNALEHIKTQVKKCNGKEEVKKTFKEIVKGYFHTMDESTLDKFKENATACI